MRSDMESNEPLKTPCNEQAASVHFQYGSLQLVVDIHPENDPLLKTKTAAEHTKHAPRTRATPHAP